MYEESSIKPLRVVLLAYKKDHGPAGNGSHDYPLWQERWALLLGGSKASNATQVNLHGSAIEDPSIAAGAQGVTAEKAWGWPTDQQFADSDVIVAFCYLEWNAERKLQVKKYLQRGGGLVLIHSATWTKPKADQEVAELVGIGGFSKFRHGLLPIEITDTSHPICRNLPGKILLFDEPYWLPMLASDTASVKHIGCSLERTGEYGVYETQPLFWTYTLGKGRVFGFVPGHYTYVFDDPWVRLLLLRSIAWCAGDSPYRLDTIALRGVRFEPASQ
ncbi:MAG: ThuA domain-containing protein [Kiritimatiellia bacterium]